MRHVVIHAVGGPEQLAIEALSASPEPGPQQVVVDVEAAGINYLDVMQRKGVAP